MRQVDLPELTYKIAAALRHVRPMTFKDAVSHSHEVKDRAKVTIANVIVRALSDLEVMTEAPDTPETTFTGPLARMAGEDVATGAPVIE